jgi:hypothetical protein
MYALNLLSATSSLFVPHKPHFFGVFASSCWTSPTNSSTRSPISAVVSQSTVAETRWKLEICSSISVRAHILVLHPSPSTDTYAHRTQPQHSHPRFFIGCDTDRAFADGCGAPDPEHTGYEEGCARRAEFASCPPSGTSGTGQTRGKALVETHYTFLFVAQLSVYLTCNHNVLEYDSQNDGIYF